MLRANWKLLLAIHSVVPGTGQPSWWMQFLMHIEMSRSMQGLFRNALVFSAQVVKEPHIKKNCCLIVYVFSQASQGSKSIHLVYWTASPVGKTGSDQREKALNRHCMTYLPYWVPPCNSFPGVVLTVGCSNVALSDVRFWGKLILAAAAWQQNQMRLFSWVMLGCASIWHLPLRVATLC